MLLKNSHTWLLATFLTSAFAGSGLACAQETSSPASPDDASASTGTSEASQEDETFSLPVVVVSAQKRSESLQDVPIAVTAIGSGELEAKGMATTEDIAALTPGLTYSQVAGSAAPRIRGIGTATALGGNENSVATYVDGVYYASPTSSILSLNNIEQVAVLKGPQGTLFGRNATGGLIQVITLDPEHDFSGKASATYASQDTIGASLYLTGGLADKLAADLAVTYNNQQDGFGENLFNGQDVNKSENLSIRSKWRFDIGEATTLTLSGDYASLDSAGPARRPVTGSTPITGVPYEGDGFDVNSNTQPHFEAEQGGASINLTHQFDAFDLISLTAYRESVTDLAFDADGLPLSIINADTTIREHQFSQELQAVSTGSGPLKWTVGSFYFSSKAGYDTFEIDLPPLAQTILSYQQTEAMAIYGQGTYDLTDATSLTLGLRYSDETRELDANGTIFTKATGTTAAPPPLSDEISSENPTWRIALNHQLTPQTMAYVSYNRGFKSGGFNPTTIFAGEAESFEAEELDAYEVGIKSDLLGRRLRVNASGFYYDYSEIQLASFSNGTQRITNATEAEIYGVDADITAIPVEPLTLTAGLSYLHSEFGDFPNAQISTPLPGGGNLITSGDATGNTLPFTPEWTVDLGLDYVVQVAGGDLRFSTMFFYSDGWFAESDNRLQQDSYNLLNASLKWSPNEDSGLSVSVWGKNLTEEVYALTLQTQNTSDVFVAAPGRTLGLTVGYKF